MFPDCRRRKRRRCRRSGSGKSQLFLSIMDFTKNGRPPQRAFQGPGTDHHGRQMNKVRRQGLDDLPDPMTSLNRSCGSRAS